MAGNGRKFPASLATGAAALSPLIRPHFMEGACWLARRLQISLNLRCINHQRLPRAPDIRSPWSRDGSGKEIEVPLGPGTGPRSSALPIECHPLVSQGLALPRSAIGNAVLPHGESNDPQAAGRPGRTAPGVGVAFRGG